MFNIANEINSTKLNLWIENNKDILIPINGKCYTLQIDRPFWFNDESLLKLNNMPVFVGSSPEEIFVKMYEYCLTNLKWKDGRNVNLLEYLCPLNDLLKINNIIKEINGEYYVRDHEQLTFENMHTNYDIKLTKDNLNLIEDAVISTIFDCKLYTYGFTTKYELDCCFTVNKHEIL
jgi:hypothetical protein